MRTHIQIMQRFNVSEDMLPYVIAFNAVGEQVCSTCTHVCVRMCVFVFVCVCVCVCAFPASASSGRGSVAAAAAAAAALLVVVVLV